MEGTTKIIEKIKSWESELIEWRHYLHQIPEVGFEEVKTSEFIAGKLNAWGIKTRTGIAKTGVIALLENGPGPVKQEEVFDALEWLAAMCSHVPNKGEQMVRYYGYYSNVSRGKRKKHDQDGLIPSILKPDGSSKEHRKNWARLIRKIGACPGPDPGRWIPLPAPNAGGG